MPASHTNGPSGEAVAAPRRPLRAATLGTALLLLIMIAAGLAAAFMVTPQPDDETLQRPAQSDIVLVAGPTASWDPAAISDSASAQMVSQVFEGLTVLDSASQVRPALAESWSVSKDGHRIEFLLRDGLTFSDGSLIDAEDVRRSWLRVLDPEHPSPLASLLDDVAGAADLARGTGGAEDVGIRADGRRLTVDLEHPAAFFPAVAAVPTLSVVPEDIDTLAGGPRVDSPFPASGAYVPLRETSSEVLLEANDAYWAGPPPTRRITVLTDLGERSEVDVFEDEAADWTRISTDDAAWIRYDAELGPQLRFGDEMVVEFLGFDTTSPPFDDAAVRRAVAMAVDWRRLYAGGSTDGEDPTGAPLTSIVPPGIAGRGEGDYLPPHDPDAARTALAAAGYPDGEGFPPVTLATYGVGPTSAVAHEMERELGIDVTVEQWSFDDHGTILAEETPSMWTMAWSADFPHAHDFLGLLLRSDSTANVGRWSDSDYDALIEAAAATSNAAEQERLYAEAQAILRDEVPLIPLGYGSSWALSRDGLAGSDISGVGLVRYADLMWR